MLLCKALRCKWNKQGRCSDAMPILNENAQCQYAIHPPDASPQDTPLQDVIIIEVTPNTKNQEENK